MDRTLQPWEVSFQKRTAVYKLPVGTMPSKTIPAPSFSSASASAAGVSSADEDQTARYLAQRYYDIAVAHNDRVFDADAQPWSLTGRNLRIEIAFSGVGTGREVGLEEYLEIGRRMFGTEEGEGLGVEVRDVTVQVDAKREVAEVFANQALKGRGLVRPSVVVAEFRREEGEWLLSGVKHVKGMDGVEF